MNEKFEIGDYVRLNGKEDPEQFRPGGVLPNNSYKIYHIGSYPTIPYICQGKDYLYLDIPTTTFMTTVPIYDSIYFRKDLTKLRKDKLKKLGYE